MLWDYNHKSCRQFHRRRASLESKQSPESSMLFVTSRSETTRIFLLPARLKIGIADCFVNSAEVFSDSGARFMPRGSGPYKYLHSINICIRPRSRLGGNALGGQLLFLILLAKSRECSIPYWGCYRLSKIREEGGRNFIKYKCA